MIKPIIALMTLPSIFSVAGIIFAQAAPTMSMAEVMAILFAATGTTAGVSIFFMVQQAKIVKLLNKIACLKMHSDDPQEREEGCDFFRNIIKDELGK